MAALAASLVDGSTFEFGSKAAFVADNCSLDNDDVNDDQSRPLIRARDSKRVVKASPCRFFVPPILVNLKRRSKNGDAYAYIIRDVVECIGGHGADRPLITPTAVTKASGLTPLRPLIVSTITAGRLYRLVR